MDPSKVAAYVAEVRLHLRFIIKLYRIQLAALLAPVFKEHFNQDAVPIGGSETLPVSETNDWTRVFQAVAFAFLGERESPDRQHVLWEATKYEIIEFDPLSDTRVDLGPRLSDSEEG